MITRILTALTIVFAMTACNTVSGIGKDIRSAGSAIERAAQ
ncbi:entericidin A/B family lipoprotein [Vogesella amnigena]|uniref:Entericidin A/B family lipoprotein n=1 Tax=Vogesella amnigena TaxID=1507449 RepID=A0ABV7TRP2_9NEIS